jgi:hypothetical protein
VALGGSQAFTDSATGTCATPAARLDGTCPTPGSGRGTPRYCGGTNATTRVKSVVLPSSSKCWVHVKDSNPAFTP